MRLLVKQATNNGWIEMCVPGVCDLSYPTSLLRRGRVQGGQNSTHDNKHYGNMQSDSMEKEIAFRGGKALTRKLSIIKK
jgi:hypothetical protein